MTFKQQLQRALEALYLEVDSSIADDVGTKVRQYITELNARLSELEAERDRLRAEHIQMQRMLNIETDGIDTYKEPPIFTDAALKGE